VLAAYAPPSPGHHLVRDDSTDDCVGRRTFEIERIVRTRQADFLLAVSFTVETFEPYGFEGCPTWLAACFSA
jgi:hypothetical protein